MLDVTNARDRDLRPVAEDHAALADVVRTGDVPAASPRSPSTWTAHWVGCAPRSPTDPGARPAS